MFHLYSDHMPSHGSGPIRQWIITFGKRAIRFGKGGYGNCPRPIGSWTIFPRINYYKGIAYYLNWLNMSISYLPNYLSIGSKKIF